MGSAEGGKRGGEERREVSEEEEEGEGEEEPHREIRFALPSSPPPPQRSESHTVNTLLAHSTPAHSRAHSRAASVSPKLRDAQPDKTPLFALPNVSLEAEKYEEITPTTRYAMEFPALPGTGSEAGSIRSWGSWGSSELLKGW